jgi:23S rRNA pseudouridine2605 synthase
MPAIRLQKILSQAGLASRREAERWIREGRVRVNGRVATLGQRADLSTDAVKVDGRRVHASSGPKTYLLLQKPRGYVTTVSDPEQRDTVMDLLPDRFRSRVRPVGRLDVQTEGLLLLTDDGELARDVTHPSSGCPKEYRVKVSGVPAERDLERLRRGITLDGKSTRSCAIDRVSTTQGREQGNAWFRVTLREGKSRQIRRMFEAIGHSVSKLRRVAIGPIRDDRLPVGAYRELTEREVHALEKSLKPPEVSPAEHPRRTMPRPRVNPGPPRHGPDRRGSRRRP